MTTSSPPAGAKRPSEAEWYSATSGVCDSMYLHHIVNFITGGDVEKIILHVDNSAVRMLSLKCGSGRLRHVHGRYLWLQSKVSSGHLTIKQVKTLYNIADLNTKPLPRERFMALLFMLGFVNNEGRVGEDAFTQMQSREVVKLHVKSIHKTVLEDDRMHRSTKHEQNKFTKQILRILSTFSLVQLSEGAYYSPTIHISGIPSCIMIVILSLCHSRAFIFFLSLVAMFICADGTEDLERESKALSPTEFKCVLGVGGVLFSSIGYMISGSSNADGGSSVDEPYSEEQDHSDEEDHNSRDTWSAM